MKKIALLSILIAFAGTAFAQNCNFYYLQNAKTAEITIYNKKENENGKLVYKMSNVKKSGKETTATVSSEMFDKKGKSVTTAVNNIKCNAGVLMMDMKMFISPDQQERMKASATASDVYLNYPATLNVGDALPDGNFSMDMNQDNGMKSSTEIKITERKVTGKESITTPAGTWDAYTITYHSVIKMSIAGIGIPIKMDVTEWFVPNFGTVKTTSKFGTTMLTKFE